MKKALLWLKETYIDIPTNPAIIPLLLALCMIILALQPAEARNLWVDFNLTSTHDRDNYEWNNETHNFNQRNFGLGLTYEIEDWYEVRGGFFNNSYDNTSVYGVISFKHDFISNEWMLAPSLSVGVVSGYDNTPEDAAPISWLVMPTLAVGHENLRLNIGFIPGRAFHKKDQVGVNVFTLQVGMMF